MANSIISALIGKSLLKIVNERYGREYWSLLKIVSVEIMADAETSDHPLSSKDGSDDRQYVNVLDVDLSNGKVIRPVKMRLNVICNHPATVEGLMREFQNLADTYSITTKSIIAESLVMTSLQINQTPDMISAVGISIEWEQSAPRVANQFDPKDQANASTYGLRIQGLEEGGPITLTGIRDRATSAVESLYNKVSGIV